MAVTARHEHFTPPAFHASPMFRARVSPRIMHAAVMASRSSPGVMEERETTVRHHPRNTSNTHISASAAFRKRTHHTMRLKQWFQPGPLEPGAGIFLASRCHITVPGNVANGIGLKKCSQKLLQTAVLAFGERSLTAAFQFDADGKIVAALPIQKARHTGMPGAQIRMDELHQLTMAAQEEMRRHPQASQPSKDRKSTRLNSSHW